MRFVNFVGIQLKKSPSTQMKKIINFLCTAIKSISSSGYFSMKGRARNLSGSNSATTNGTFRIGKKCAYTAAVRGYVLRAGHNSLNMFYIPSNSLSMSADCTLTSGTGWASVSFTSEGVTSCCLTYGLALTAPLMTGSLSANSLSGKVVLNF